MAQTPGATAARPQYHQQPSPYGSPQTQSLPYSQHSPNGSPYGSPQLANRNLPNNPYFTQTSNNVLTPASHNPPYTNGVHSPQPSPGISNMPPPATPGTMGPPPAKPAEERPVDVADLGDVLAGSGVDIREEEAYLFTRRTSPVNGVSTNGHGQPMRGYSVYSHNQPGPRSQFYGAGTFNQPPVTEEELRNEQERIQRSLVRQRASEISEHWKNPFIQSPQMRHKMHKAGDSLGVRLPHPVDPSNHYNPTVSIAHQGQLAVTNAAGRPIGVANEMMSLVSLACKEHLKGILEQALSLARARKQTVNGIVPPELKDIAAGPGIAAEVEVDGDAFSAIPARKRHSEDPEDGSVKKQKTIKYSDQNPQFINQVFGKEQKLDDERAKKRAARKAALLQKTVEGALASGGNSGLGADAIAPKMTKKAQKAAVAEKNMSVEQEQLAQASAAEKALGGGGKPSWLKGSGTGGKKKAWMTSTQGGNSSFSSPAPSRAPSLSQVPKATTTAPAGQNELLKPGEVREDAASGRDLEVRDIIRSLELERKEIRALSRAYNRQA